MPKLRLTLKGTVTQNPQKKKDRKEKPRYWPSSPDSNILLKTNLKYSINVKMVINLLLKVAIFEIRMKQWVLNPSKFHIFMFL